ncbi:hypothetical protein [Micromonospora sp. DT31]|uniref:hypothetical protein n=1 Tax=Micromonospora sp. DT31 TaxID=3393434 RepID=UPI003CF4AB04
MLPKRLAFLAVTALLLIFLLLALVEFPWANLAVHIIFGALAVGAFVVLVLLRETPNLKAMAPGAPVAESPSREEIQEAASYVARNYDPYAIACFINLLLDPPRSLARVHDEVEPNGRMLRVRTTLQYRIDLPRSVRRMGDTGATGAGSAAGPAGTDPRSDEGPRSERGATGVLIPLVTARKGLLFDLVSATDAKGETISVLSQREVRGLTALAIESLFLLARQETAQRPTSPVLRTSDRDIMARVIVAICRPAAPPVRTGGARLTDAPKSAWEEVQDALKQVTGLSEEISAVWRDKILDICKVLARSYVVVGEVPVPETMNVLVTYSSLYSPERMHVSPYEKLRARFGLAPFTLDVPMTRALQAESYHFELLAPAGCYVFSHHLEVLGGREILRQPHFKINGFQQYVRLHHEQARPVAHLYVRRHGRWGDLRSIGPGERVSWDFKSIVYLREIPPGALGNAATLATLTAIVLLFFTLSRAGLDNAAAAVGLPALVLALPAFVAGALGRGLDQERVGRASLIAYFGLHSVMFLSFAGVLLYVLDAAKRLPTEVTMRLAGLPHEVRTDVLWLVLSFLALVLATFLIRQRQQATRYYLNAQERAVANKHVEPGQTTSNAD